MLSSCGGTDKAVRRSTKRSTKSTNKEVTNVKKRKKVKEENQKFLNLIGSFTQRNVLTVIIFVLFAQKSKVWVAKQQALLKITFSYWKSPIIMAQKSNKLSS